MINTIMLYFRKPDLIKLQKSQIIQKNSIFCKNIYCTSMDLNSESDREETYTTQKAVDRKEKFNKFKNTQDATSSDQQVLIPNPQAKRIQTKKKEQEEQNIYCQICWGYAVNALVCNNKRCNKLFCYQCQKNLRKKIPNKCPFCQMEPILCYPSPQREIINLTTIVCQLCQDTYFLYEEQLHFKNKCSYLDRKACHFCPKYISKDKILIHTKKMHSDKMDQIITLLYEHPLPIIEASKVLNQNKIYLSKINKLPKLGDNGKIYCGGRLQTKCTCCNGNCGPTNGQNCVLCMKLDIKRLGLPKGYLLNSLGQICYKKGNDFICGINQGYKGNCDEGNYCRSCSNMKKNIERYQQLI